MSGPAQTMEEVAADMRRVANYGGIYTGFVKTRADEKYISRCRRILREHGCVLLFTRDGGMHSCGWWKNPDYEHCLHLSISFFDPETGQPAPHDHDAAKRWIRIFFDGMTNYVWSEPPFSPDGKRKDVWHYRVFVGPDFRTPLLPRGEVYSRELTEAGWKSWSDQHDGDAQETAHT